MSAPLIDMHPELASDWWEVEALFDLCFAPGRTALSSYRLREDVPSVAGLSTVARDGQGILAGAIRYWPVRIGAARSLLLGPVAVHPTHQGEGLGALLIQGTLQKAAETGWERVMLVGDAPYYSRFGFTRLDAVRMPPPTNPERVLGLGDWQGIEGDVQAWRD